MGRIIQVRERVYNVRKCNQNTHQSEYNAQPRHYVHFFTRVSNGSIVTRSRINYF